MEHRCVCGCHRIVDAFNDPRGVDITDEYHAFTACAACQPSHAVALSGRPEELPPLPLAPPRPPCAVPFDPPTRWSKAEDDKEGGTGCAGEDGG